MGGHYRVSYKVEGVRIMNVWLPDGLEPPKGFHLWDYPQRTNGYTKIRHI